jgi:hypothetical protein
MLHYTKVERLARDKHSSLLGPFINYEENENDCEYNSKDHIHNTSVSS